MGEIKNCTKCNGSKFTKDLEGNLICTHCGANYGLRTDVAASAPHTFWPEAHNHTRLSPISLDSEEADALSSSPRSPVWIYFTYLLLIIPMTLYDIARIFNGGALISVSADLLIGITVWGIAGLLRYWQFANYKQGGDLLIALMATAVVVIKLFNLSF